MATYKGYIKLHRSLFNHWIWTNTSEKFNLRSAWIDLLLLANHDSANIRFNGDVMHIKRGCHMTSVSKLADRWMVTEKTVRGWLNKLQQDEMITFDSTKKGTLIHIVNYEKYQPLSKENGPEKGRTEGQTLLQISGKKNAKKGEQKGKPSIPTKIQQYQAELEEVGEQKGKQATEQTTGLGIGRTTGQTTYKQIMNNNEKEMNNNEKGEKPPCPGDGYVWNDYLNRWVSPPSGGGVWQ